ncbi:MAG: citrate transporter, partial [Pseudomonadota bacterium]|nr:citrate transporter [Pseudomonadota bacterium]
MKHSQRVATLLFACLAALPGVAAAADGFAGPSIGPVPLEFILFGCVLAGVALFHHHTLPVALGGAIVIALYKIVLSPFGTGAG